ncbi:LysR family transcriptional regulator [Streptomyces sp. KR80]|uniref:LysR family transcriptional regulator n=1 Tax=Streptomyces sp. KR80 TaxID=3457426 RepID=UPI003FD6033D
MNLQQLRTFREVAAELSFTRAAEKLHYAQSSVTSQIRNLEEAVGAPLFDRSGRRISLTDAGMRLLPYADEILHIVEAAQKEVDETVIEAS